MTDQPQRPASLTIAEQTALEMLGEIYAAFCDIIGQGSTRDADLGEAVTHIHALQHMLMAQAAGRAYPDLYRLLGDAS